nr:MAG TPA: hypothetical protein [Bacteriophage sp.]
MSIVNPIATPVAAYKRNYLYSHPLFELLTMCGLIPATPRTASTLL